MKGTYDNNYDFVFEKMCIDKHGMNFKYKTNLLNSMAEKKYYDSKYYLDIIKSDKKNLNLVKKMVKHGFIIKYKNMRINLMKI